MRKALILAAAASALAVTACGPTADNGSAPRSEAARNAAGDKTIASSLGGDDSRFAEAARATGLDATLAGPGPYTVLVPSNAAFDKMPAGAFDNLMKPGARPQLTRMLTGLILPGEVLAADIDKAIDNGKGKASLATFGGGTITATRDGDRIILADSAGNKAVVVAADDKKSNGVIHRVDGVLMPGTGA